MARATAQMRLPKVPPDQEHGRKRRRILAALAGFALGVVLALALSPRSQWLVRMQLSGRPALPERTQLLRHTAEAMAADPGAQAAWGAWNLGRGEDASGTPFTTVRPLVERFPNNPVALAAALRLTINNGDAAHTLDVAARGAKADPQNAFFPMVRAATLFRAGRDADGATALADAAGRPRWDDYTAEQVRGGWRLSDVVFGEGNVVARLDFMRNVDLSVYETLGAAALSAAKYAGRLERRGNLAAGYQVRRDLMTVGERMRRDASTGVGTLAGIRVTGTAANHLLGRAEPLTRFALPSAAEGQGALEDYLRTTGHAGDLPRVKHLASLARETSPLVASKATFDAFDWSSQVFRLHTWIVAASFLLLVAAWLGLMGLLFGGWRAPSATAGRSRKFGAFALPVACVLLIVYGVVSLQTLRVSAQINRNLSAMVHHEGRFYAALLGRPWPE